MRGADMILAESERRCLRVVRSSMIGSLGQMPKELSLRPNRALASGLRDAVERVLTATVQAAAPNQDDGPEKSPESSRTATIVPSACSHA